MPNGSFEQQSGVGQPFNTNINVDSWQKPDRPDYFPAGGYNGFYWVQTSGVFVDTNPYTNHAGTQAAYVLPFPTAGFFQDYNTIDYDDTMPSHAFDATYLPGKSYTLTIGVYGKGLVDNYSSILFSLYYRDDANAIVPIQSTLLTYTTAQFPGTAPLSLVDAPVFVSNVQPGEAWAGRKIGIQVQAVAGDGQGNWDLDNVRLSETPEPSTAVLLALGLGGLVSRRRFVRTIS